MKLRRSLYAHSKPFPRGAPWRGFMLRSAPLVALSAASVRVRHLSNWSRGRPVSMVRFLQLRGGDVNGDFVGVPASQLAVFPGTTHFFGLAKTELVLGAVLPFLDAAPT